MHCIAPGEYGVWRQAQLDSWMEVEHVALRGKKHELAYYGTNGTGIQDIPGMVNERVMWIWRSFLLPSAQADLSRMQAIRTKWWAK